MRLPFIAEIGILVGFACGHGVPARRGYQERPFILTTGNARMTQVADSTGMQETTRDIAQARQFYDRR